MVGKTVALDELRERIRALEGHVFLPPFEKGGPGGILPQNAGLHEYIALQSENAALGWMVATLKKLGTPQKPIVWISQRPSLYPPGLSDFGLPPEQILFIQVANPKEALWVAEKTLEELPALVVGENLKLNLTTARRLQLACGKLQNMLFLLHTEKIPAPCHIAMTRWHISTRLSSDAPGLFSQHGVGQMRFRIELVRCRGAMAPAAWDVEWNDKEMDFNLVDESQRRRRQFEHLVPEGQEIRPAYRFG
ncbi:MAG: hypothetical protein V4534_02350 [Myxococcota bacterium]